MRRTFWCLSALFSAALAQPVSAQAPGRSAIFPVNAYTTGQQGAPDVASAPDGSFVVVWESSGQEPGQYAGTGVYARRFDALGVALGDEFLVNEYTFLDQGLPRVATDSSGNFIVIWQEGPPRMTAASTGACIPRGAPPPAPNSRSTPPRLATANTTRPSRAATRATSSCGRPTPREPRTRSGALSSAAAPTLRADFSR